MGVGKKVVWGKSLMGYSEDLDGATQIKNYKETLYSGVFWKSF